MSWKYIFNTTVGDVWWGLQDHAEKAAKDSGYKFYSWNGNIYGVGGGDIGIRVEDCF